MDGNLIDLLDELDGYGITFTDEDLARCHLQDIGISPNRIIPYDNEPIFDKLVYAVMSIPGVYDMETDRGDGVIYYTLPNKRTYKIDLSDITESEKL